MEENPPQDNPDGNSNQSPPSPPPTTEEYPIPDEENGGGTNNANKETKQRKRYKGVKTWANIFINLSLAIGTWLLYNVAVNQSEHAKTAAASAKKSADIAEQSIKQFEAENIPYLVIKSFTPYSFAPKSQFVIKFEIANVGKQPVRIISVKSTIKIMARFDSVAIQNSMKEELTNTSRGYIINQFTYFAFYKTPFKVSQEEYNSVRNLSKTMYWVGEVIYENLITNKKRKFYFAWEFLDDTNLKGINMDNSNL